MPNGTGYLDPDDWRILDLALQDLDETIAAFAATHGATITRGNDTSLPYRAVTAGDQLQRTLRVAARFDFANPTYDISISALAQQGRDVFRKREVLAAGVADADLADAFARAAEPGWALVQTWTRDDLEPSLR